jgi:hypothetical protein
MSATERVIFLLNARQVRPNEFRAKCPVHQGRSNRSLSIRDAGDRVLLHCHAGCDYKSIISVLGLESAAELFEYPRRQPDPEMQRQARIRRGLGIWCERRLKHVCKRLREIDAEISIAAGSLAGYESGRMRRDYVGEQKQ